MELHFYHHHNYKIGVPGHNTESLHFLTEQWAKDEHVGCKRTNSADLFLWIPFPLFSSLIALTQNHSALSYSAPSHNSALSLFHRPFLSLPLSFSAVTSSVQLPSIALWRTKPGFVYMATERRDRWGWSEGWGRENDRYTRNQAHTHVCIT